MSQLKRLPSVFFTTKDNDTTQPAAAKRLDFGTDPIRRPGAIDSSA